MSAVDTTGWSAQWVRRLAEAEPGLSVKKDTPRGASSASSRCGAKTARRAPSVAYAGTSADHRTTHGDRSNPGFATCCWTSSGSAR